MEGISHNFLINHIYSTLYYYRYESRGRPYEEAPEPVNGQRRQDTNGQRGQDANGQRRQDAGFQNQNQGNN